MNWSFANKPGLVCGCIHVLALLATAIHSQSSSCVTLEKVVRD